MEESEGGTNPSSYIKVATHNNFVNTTMTMDGILSGIGQQIPGLEIISQDQRKNSKSWEKGKEVATDAS